MKNTQTYKTGLSGLNITPFFEIIEINSKDNYENIKFSEETITSKMVEEASNYLYSKTLEIFMNEYKTGTLDINRNEYEKLYTWARVNLYEVLQIHNEHDYEKFGFSDKVILSKMFKKVGMHLDNDTLETFVEACKKGILDINQDSHNGVFYKAKECLYKDVTGYNQLYIPMIFNEGIALKCNLIPLSFNNKKALALGEKGSSDLYPRLELYQFLANGTFHVNSDLYDIIIRGRNHLVDRFNACTYEHAVEEVRSDYLKGAN